MTYDEFTKLWASLDEDQKESIRLKCQWEHMGLWAVCNEWPGIWNDPDRLKTIREDKAARK